MSPWNWKMFKDKYNIPFVSFAFTFSLSAQLHSEIKIKKNGWITHRSLIKLQDCARMLHKGLYFSEYRLWQRTKPKKRRKSENICIKYKKKCINESFFAAFYFTKQMKTIRSCICEIYGKLTECNVWKLLS